MIDGKTGILYNDASVDGLLAALDRFEASGLGDHCRDACVAHAQNFSEAHFHDGLRKAIAAEGIRLGGSVIADESNVSAKAMPAASLEKAAR